MMRLAEAEWMALLDRSGTRSMLNEDGALELYESEAEFRASLPEAGVDGTLASRMRPAQGLILAKTGTVRATSCIAGYVTTRSGSRYAFAFIANNAPSARQAGAALDAMAVALATH